MIATLHPHDVKNFVDLPGWLRTRGINPNDVYRLDLWGPFAVVHRFARDDGRFYVDEDGEIATRVPIVRWVGLDRPTPTVGS